MLGTTSTRIGRCLLAVGLFAIGSCSSATETREGPAGEVRTLTGAHTRVVWVQHDGNDPTAGGDSLLLMGFDTEDGRGERVILGQRGSYVQPLLTPAGTRAVFSRRPTRPEGAEVFVVNWDGSGLRPLARGFALATWADPADGREWVYVGTDNKKGQEYDFATVTRMLIDDPATRELVWNKSPVSGFQLSADGRRAGGLFPWPDAGVAELPNGAMRKLGEGCWTAMSTVRGPILWYFDGAHRNLTLVDIRSEKRWVVNINRVPGFGNDEVFHPRWANHPRFLAMTGPYNRGGVNQVRSGGAQAEVYLGRFSADYSSVEAWARVTRNAAGDAYPDVWIDRRRSPHDVAPPGGALGPATAGTGRPGESLPSTAAPDTGRVVVEARLLKAGAVPSPQAIAPYQHALVVNTYEVLKVAEGTYAERTVLVAQWAIRDRKVLPGARRTPGSTHRLTLERYDAHPELEGERLISSSDTPDQALYYEVAPKTPPADR